MNNQELNDEIYDALCNIYTEQFNAEMNVCDALDKLDDKELIMSEYIQEYKRLPTSMVKQNQNKTKNENIGKLRNLKSFVRKNTSKSGNGYEFTVTTHDNISKEQFNLLYDAVKNLILSWKNKSNNYNVYKNKLLKLIGVHQSIDMVQFEINHCYAVTFCNGEVIEKTCTNDGIEFEELLSDYYFAHQNTVPNENIRMISAEFYIIKPSDIIRPGKNRVFIHQSDVKGLKKLIPTGYDEKYYGGHDYGGKAIFFVALNNLDPDQREWVTDGDYGKYAYEYIPKPTDIFHIDKNDQDAPDRFWNYLQKMGISATPVFIKTDKPLPVRQINKRKFNKETKEYAKNPENYIEKNTWHSAEGRMYDWANEIVNNINSCYESFKNRDNIDADDIFVHTCAMYMARYWFEKIYHKNPKSLKYLKQIDAAISKIASKYDKKGICRRVLKDGKLPEKYDKNDYWVDNVLADYGVNEFQLKNKLGDD